MKSFLSIVITLEFKSKTLTPFISDPCPSSDLCLHLILSQAHGWNSKRDLPVGSSFCSVTRKQLLSQLAVYACRIPGCQKCSWRTNRQPVSSSSSTKAVKTTGASGPTPPSSCLRSSFSLAFGSWGWSWSWQQKQYISQDLSHTDGVRI